MWNDETMRALRAWLGPDTWYKGHQHEDGRFYEFIYKVWQERQGLWDESAAREKIEQEALTLHPGLTELAKEVAEERQGQGTLILDYLSHIKQRGLK